MKKFFTILAIFLGTASVLSMPPTILSAKDSGRNDKIRSEFYGIVQARPMNKLPGEWVIGGLTLTTDADTEFDQAEGQLEAGSCAKVKIRNNRVHEIEREPMRDCQTK